MEQDLISVIVPVYNTGQKLSACIESIVCQEYTPIEIILVDDGSTDEDTLAICEHYSLLHTNICVIHQKNGGPSKARNTGMDKAKGKYIAFVDSDDYIDSDAYIKLHNAARDYNVPLVLGAMEIDGAAQQSGACRLNDGKYSREQILTEFMLGSWHSACTNLYSKSLIETIRFPLNEINEDYIFNFEVLLTADEIAVVSKPFYHYIKQPDSRTGAPASLKHLDWLRHTDYVKKKIGAIYGGALSEEATYQSLFANIVLSNKCILSIANGFNNSPSALYKITTGNLKSDKSSIWNNPYLTNRYRFFALALSYAPALYKSAILTLLKIKRCIR